MLNKKLIKNSLEVHLFSAHQAKRANPNNSEFAEVIHECAESLTNFERDWREMEDSVSAQQQLTAQKRELEQQLQQAQTKVNDYNRLQTNLTTCQSEGGRLKKEKTELTNQISTLQTQLTTRNNELNSRQISFEHQQSSWQRERSNLISQIRSKQELERKLAQVESKIQQIKKKLAEWVKLVREREIKEPKKGWFW